MKNKIKKIIIIVIIIILIIISSLFIIAKIINKKETRINCSETALNFVKNKSEKRMSYSNQERDTDYKFMYNYCFQQKGLNPEF